MKNIGRISLYILLGSFIFIQFFRVQPNISEEVSGNDFLKQNPGMPEQMQETFKRSCYDCHSNNTDYPWYAYVAPFSWVIDQHIRNGKHELNFSEYAQLDKKHKIAILDEICESISDTSMPPANYLMLNKDAALDFDDITAICDWSEGTALMILRSK